MVDYTCILVVLIIHVYILISCILIVLIYVVGVGMLKLIVCYCGGVSFFKGQRECTAVVCSVVGHKIW